MATTSQNNTPTTARSVVQFNSTPLVKRASAFSSEVPPTHDKRKLEFEFEMRDRFLGPMPVKTFLKKYLSPKGETVNVPSHLRHRIACLPRMRDERLMYDPFIEAIASCIPGFKAVNTSNMPARSDFADFQLKPDICLFNNDFDPRNFKKRSYFSVMEMWIEFKHQESLFADPPAGKEIGHTTHAFEVDSKSAQLARGQLTAYAIAQHAQQFRHFSFSVSIMKNCARFLRWDPAGVVVTEKFNFVENPQLMAQFFWSFSHLTDEQRGHDVSVRPMEEGDVVLQKEVRDNLGLLADQQLFEYGVPHLPGRCYGPAPPYPCRSIVGRSTRSLPIFYKPGTQDIQVADESYMSGPGRVAYLKDAWRYRSGDDEEIDTECKIYSALNAMSIPYVPTLEGGGDITGYGSTSETQKLVNDPGLKLTGKLKATGFTHYRLVLDVVGRALSTFKNTKELVNGTLCAIIAHEEAFKLLKLLHRDVSFGNIILTNDGTGWLIDWEFAKYIDKIGNSRPERTGTWQFMSARLLKQPDARHTLADDLESFLHVLAWATIRYVPAVEGPFRTSCYRERYLSQLFDASWQIGDRQVGGEAKEQVFQGVGYPPPAFRLNSPLRDLLQQLSKPFKSFYSASPTKQERLEYESFMTKAVRRDPATLPYDVYKYDLDLERLKSHTYFINTFKNSLNAEWPSDDKADPSVVDFYSTRMTAQERGVRRSRMDMDQKQWENSKGIVGLSGSLKRSSLESLPVVSSSKRPRTTPT